MIIAISGMSGSGKNTLGSLLAKELGFRHICPTFKDLAEAKGIPLLEFQKMAENDPNIDKKFDMLLKDQAKEGNCVVTTWLGPWVVDPDIAICVFAPKKVRAHRLGERDGLSDDEALEHINERDENNKKRYLDIYGIDICDQSGFDICLNSGLYKPQELLEMVLKIIEINRGK
jgi:cytidylate kinase